MRRCATSNLYNAQDQLTSATTSGSTTSYAYTLSGALSSVTPAGGSAQNYTSDAFGNLVSLPGGIAYAYDALGRLVTRTVGSGSTSLSYLGTGSTLTFDGTRQYSYTPDGTIAATKGTAGNTTPFVTMTNLHGDLAATFSPTSTAAGLAGYATYSPYGTPSATGYRPALGYQGDYTDASTHLVDMGARWYNSSTGSFTTNDTIAGSPLSATIDGNPYAYTSGNPLTQTDPTGHCTDPAPVVVDGVIIGTTCPGDPVDTGSQGGLQPGQFCQAFDDCPGQQPVQRPVQPPVECTDNCGTQTPASCSGMEGLSSSCGLAPPAPPVPGWTPPPGGPCTYNCGPWPVPSPPPPPRDCYAVSLCVPPKPPGSADVPIWITTRVKGWVNFSTLCRLSTCIFENLQSTPAYIKGTTQDKNENGGINPDETGGINPDETGPISDIGVPDTPQASDPTGDQGNSPTAAEVLANPQLVRGLTPQEIDALAREAGYDVQPGSPSSANPATRYYVPGTKKSIGFRVLPQGVPGQSGIYSGPYLRYFGMNNGIRVPLAGNPTL